MSVSILYIISKVRNNYFTLWQNLARQSIDNVTGTVELVSGCLGSLRVIGSQLTNASSVYARVRDIQVTDGPFECLVSDLTLRLKLVSTQTHSVLDT